MNATTLISVLYLDDEVHNLTAFKASFRRVYNIYTAESAIEARQILDSTEIDVIITDQRMPVTTGIEFLKSIIPLYPKPSRILLTGYTDTNTINDAIEKGYVQKCILKPWSEDELHAEIEKAINFYSGEKNDL
ncbi:MAG: response regulator [Pedobacter sp.]